MAHPGVCLHQATNRQQAKQEGCPSESLYHGIRNYQYYERLSFPWVFLKIPSPTPSPPPPPTPCKELGVAQSQWVMCRTTSSSKGSFTPTQPHHHRVLNFHTAYCYGVAEVQCMTLSYFHCLRIRWNDSSQCQLCRILRSDSAYFCPNKSRQTHERGDQQAFYTFPRWKWTFMSCVLSR